MSATVVTVRRSACLRSRLRTSDCSACADACPVQALRVGREGVTAQAGCTGCGRCRAACPMGAIAVSGFAAMATAEVGAGGATLLVDCARFGAPPAGPDSLRVPCLGGLSPGDLLALCAQAPGRTVLLADHEACALCDSGRTVHAAAAVLQSVRDLMREANVPEDRLPRLVRRPAPPSVADPMQSGGRAR
ncbi:MAG TPA: 4Fe-4S dicluster domain-containing protein, partial [Ramlibacter sp.]